MIQCALLLVGVAQLAWPASAVRADEPTRRVVVLGPITEALLERVEGQTGDLPWEIVRRPDGSPRREALDDVRRVARAARATVAIWFDESDAAITVFVVEVTEARLFARRIDDAVEGEPMGTSARLEAAALVVRSALRDLADGGHIGVVVETPVARPPERPDRAMPDVSRTRARERADASLPSPTRFSASLGWAVGLDGNSPAGQQGPSGALAIEHRWARFEIGFASSLGASLEDDRTTVQLTRHVFRAGVGVVIDPDRTWSLSALATGGVVVLSRATVAVAENVSAEPESDSVLGTFGIEARLTWLPMARVLGVEPVLGLDAIPASPVLGYRDGGRVVERNRIWILSPWLGLTVTLRTR